MIAVDTLLIALAWFLVGWLSRRKYEQWHGSRDTRATIEGGGLMFIVKDDNPDVGYTITPPTVTDAEGSPIPPTDLVYDVSSDNAGAVAITVTDQLTGTVHFGSPNADGTPATANVNVKVSDKAGTLLGSFGAQFTVTPGDPAKIVGGSVAFAGLTAS